MTESSENMERFFRNKLENYSESPPQDTWDKIADSLGHRQKRKMAFFISRIAAGLTILISLSILFYYTQKEKPAEIAYQSDTITTVKIHPDETSQVQISEKPAGQTRHVLTETGVSGKENQDRAAYARAADSQTSRQTVQTGSITEDEMLRKHSSVEDMASAYISVPDRLSYLVPIECDYLDAVNFPNDQAIPSGDFRTGGQAGKVLTDQLLAFADEEPGVKERQTAWLIGGQFAPLYSYRNLTSEKYQDYVREQINSKESGILAYAGGINLTVSPNKRLSVQSGLYYSVYGQEKNSLEYAAFITNEPANDKLDNPEWYNIGSEEQIQAVYVGNSTGKIMAFDETLSDTRLSPSSYMQADQSSANQLNSSLPISSVTQYFEYLELPVNLKYKVMDKKFDVSLMGGISANFLIGTDIQLNYADNSSTNTDYTTEGLNRINYSSLIGIGFEYPLFKNLILNIEPKFRYYLNSINEDQAYDIRPYSIGIFSGVSYLF
jgi:hypothetical protein